MPPRPGTKSETRILVADNDKHTPNTLVQWLGQTGASVTFVSSGAEALNYLCDEPLSAAVMDLHLPDLNGLEVYREALRNGCTTPVIFLSSNPPVETVVQAMKLGAYDFMTRPIVKEIFLRKLAQLINGKISSSAHLANRIDQHLAAHCHQPSLCVNDICAHFGISQRYVSKLFKEHLKTSFRNRLVYHRIQIAKNLLQITDHPLYTVAEQCGFKHQSRLTEAFRKFEHTTPRQYRLFNNNLPPS